MTTTSSDRNTVLDEVTCRQLLGTVRVGRIAFADDPSPTVLPVDYVVHDDVVLFRTLEGTKLEVAHRNGAASFQTDGFDPSHDTGWSVLVRGHLDVLEDLTPDQQEAVDRLHPLVGGDRPHVVRLTIDEVSGRRVLQDPDWVRAHLDTNTWTDRDGSDLLG